ncbi:MAG: hypothetical protein WDM90_22360 [Ferruginibacter sp.]
MKKIVTCLAGSFFVLHAIAQDETKKDLFGFTITNYIVSPNDSFVIVQVEMPETPKNVLEMKKIGQLRRNYTNAADDTASIGIGKCQLIKGNYYYFGLRLSNKNNLPKENDLLYVFTDYPATYKGRIYGLIRNAIYLTHVTENKFYEFGDAALLDEKKENSLIDSLVADIKYTATEMLQQNNNQDQIIKGGIFDGKKLFAAMQNITSANVKLFLDYVIARPKKYAGNNWKVSETIATWMINETPAVVKQ